jgi:hypothetical protein
MRAQSITASLGRSPVVAIAPKNVPERLRHRYASLGQLTVLSPVLVFWPYGNRVAARPQQVPPTRDGGEEQRDTRN